MLHIKSSFATLLSLLLFTTVVYADNNSELSDLEQILQELRENGASITSNSDSDSEIESASFKNDGLAIPLTSKRVTKENANKAWSNTTTKAQENNAEYLKNEIVRYNQNKPKERPYTTTSVSYAKPRLLMADIPVVDNSNNFSRRATVIREPAILRVSPSRESSHIYTLPLGSSINVQMTRGDWYYVEANNHIKAWVPAEYLAIRDFN